MSKNKNKNKNNVSDKKIQNSKNLENGLTGFTESFTRGKQLSQLDTLQLNNRYYYIFNNRELLNTVYIEHGIIQTLIDQPVDDAFRGGITIKTKQLDEEEIKELQQYLEVENIIQKIMQTIKWGRLFGGGGLVIITSQDPTKPFDINKINKFTPLDFYAADLWELNMQYYTSNPLEDLEPDNPYMFYGTSMHKSRVLTYRGKEAPSMRRRQFRGWGMTEVEKIIRAFNKFLKNNNVIFDLLDEAKVDVYKLENFNNSMLSNQEDAISDRIQLSNMLKNYLNALVMDSTDEYQQKQVTFAGLGEMLEESRMDIASNVKFPLTKLFGIAPSGLSNNDETGTENYNSMVEGEVRNKVKGMTIETLRIVAKKLFDIVVDDFEIEFAPLRILNAEQEENVKDAQANRLLSFFSSGLISVAETKAAINKDSLVAVEIEVNDELDEQGLRDQVSIADSDNNVGIKSI